MSIYQQELVMKDRNEFLEHHGIQGQKWGVRNALWYPIEAFRKSGKGKQYKHKGQNHPNQTQRKLRPEQQAPVEKPLTKEDILRSDDLNLIYKHKEMFTTQEIADAIKRDAEITKLRDILEGRNNPEPVKQVQTAPKETTMDDAIKFIEKQSNRIKTVTTAINNATKFINALEDVSDAYVSVKNIKKNGGYIKSSERRLQGKSNKDKPGKDQKKDDKQQKKEDDD